MLLAHDIRSPVARIEIGSDRLFDAVCFLCHVEAVTQHHGGGEDGSHWVCDVAARNVGGRTVDRLIQTAARRTQAGGGDKVLKF